MKAILGAAVVAGFVVAFSGAAFAQGNSEPGLDRYDDNKGR